MIKNVCISGYYGFDNFGDEAVLKVLLNNLKSLKDPPDITVFSHNPAKTATDLKVKSVQTFNPFFVAFSILKCDFLISGGGSLLQDVTSINSLIYYLAVLIMAWCFRKKIIIFAQGIGPINNTFFRKITFFILKKAVYISVRDEKSLDLLLKNNIKNPELCFDPVWNIDINNNVNSSGIGIQLRKFSFIDDFFLQKLALNINKYYSNKKIYLLSLQNSLDLAVCNKFKSVLLNINNNLNVSVIQNTSTDSIIGKISSLESIIAMRYHACLIAIKANINVLPINYDIKVGNLAKEFNLNCINSINDIDEAFEKFINTKTRTNNEKNSQRKFDFSKLNALF